MSSITRLFRNKNIDELYIYRNIQEYLTYHPVYVNYSDIDGNTMCHLASQYGYITVIKLLLSFKANINSINQNNMSPLHLALLYGHDHCTDLLLNNRADLNCTPNPEDVMFKITLNQPLHSCYRIMLIHTNPTYFKLIKLS